MNGASIVIPVYNALEDAKKCVESIYASRTSVEFEVIVVNNGSRREVAEWLASEQTHRSNFKALHFDEPLGFARAMNEGVRHAKRDFIVLLNSDALVTNGWLDILASALTDDPALGIVSPVTNRCGQDSQCDPGARSLSPGNSQLYAESIRHRRQVIPEFQRLAFFCVVLRRELWEQLAGFDEIFRTANFEDDDFCARARFAGYRMAVVWSAFVFHGSRRTFEANGLNFQEHLTANQAIFGERLSRWSRTLRPVIPGARSAVSVSVIVPTLPGRAIGLRDSLASLANQTVQGFEVVVVCPAGLDISQQLGAFSTRLRIKVLSVDAGEGEGLAPLLNSGLTAASGTEIAYLPAADIYYPIHLELLLDALQSAGAQAVHSAWNVVSPGPNIERRIFLNLVNGELGVEVADWAPILCWLYRRSGVTAEPFDPSFGGFSTWAFALKLRASVKSHYVGRATCERSPDPPSARDVADAERVMNCFPVKTDSEALQRRQFLEAVRLGGREERQILERNQRVGRWFSLFDKGKAIRRDPQEFASLRRRLEDSTAGIRPNWRNSAKPDIFLFSIIEWTSLTQRPHHFATGLASRGHRVFWVNVRLRPPERVNSGNLVREVKPGIYQLDLPAPWGEIYHLEWRQEVIDMMVACFDHLRVAYDISSAVQLVNFPRWEPLVQALNQKYYWRIIYDCLDDQRAFADLFGHDLGQSEVILRETSSKVLVSGRVLYDAARTSRPDAVLIPNAADFDLFHKTLPAGLLDHLPRPIVGFFGAFADWLDFEWIEAAASRFPEWSFVYIGRESFANATTRQLWKTVTGKINVHILPQAAPEKLAQYLAQMDVCTMPFQDIPATRSMNAVKLFEYLAAGKPVVAPSLPETQPLGDAGLIATYRSHEESFQLLEEAVRAGASEDAVAARLAFAARNTWAHRVDELSAALGL